MSSDELEEKEGEGEINSDALEAAFEEGSYTEEDEEEEPHKSRHNPDEDLDDLSAEMQDFGGDEDSW